MFGHCLNGNSVLDKDGVFYITTIGIEEKIHGLIDLQDPQSFDFDMFHNRLIPTLQKGRLTISAIIHSLKKPSTATFPKSIVRKAELESWGCDGRRGLNLVDDKLFVFDFVGNITALHMNFLANLMQDGHIYSLNMIRNA